MSIDKIKINKKICITLLKIVWSGVFSYKKPLFFCIVADRLGGGVRVGRRVSLRRKSHFPIFSAGEGRSCRPTSTRA